MILKVRTDRTHGSWRYFDADEVQTAQGVVTSLDERIEGVAYHDFQSGAHKGFVTVSFIGNGDKPTEITSDMEIYLLNNSGQTIDRLN